MASSIDSGRVHPRDTFTALAFIPQPQCRNFMKLAAAARGLVAEFRLVVVGSAVCADHFKDVRGVQGTSSCAATLRCPLQQLVYSPAACASMQLPVAAPVQKDWSSF